MPAPAIPPSPLTAAAISNTGGALTAYAHELPAGLGWNHTLLPLNLRSFWQASGLRTGTCGLTAKQVFARFSTACDAPQRTFYVKRTGSDSANGLTWATAVASIWKAIELRNAFPTETARINVDAAINNGLYPRGNGLSNNGTPVLPVFDTAFVSYYGKVRTGTFEMALTFAVDATHTNTYSVARANVDRVLDLSRPLATGGYFELTNVATAAACNMRPDSWALVSGTLYVNRLDGAQPVTSGNNPNTLVNLSLNLNNYSGTPVNLYFGGENSGDGFEFFGQAVFNYNARPVTPKAHIFEGCTFNYGGGLTSGYASRGLTVESLDGLAACFNCSGTGNATDTFNLHYANAGAAGGKLYFYSENCSAFDHGRGSGTSCNGLTLHEDVIAVDLCGRYFNGRGGTVSNVNASKHFLAATHVEGDVGDRGSGGPNAPMAIRAGDTSQLWTDMVSVNMPSGSIGFYTTTGAAIRGRREITSPGGRTGNGTFGTW
ncbi:hypothetical protein [Asticcacaulis sp. AND118]|uniref:hypothetical protein n=1 Tax=Asticcacaulis sp. AND118 TaxID=2840468 RepID=UPI001CFFA690|nr:hypothetical protein [Asticcacaulis sp. AND118]UDF02605.1 hypothetical protein LH365_09180 [Asticcacaulis sp. AND118]